MDSSSASATGSTNKLRVTISDVTNTIKIMPEEEEALGKLGVKTQPGELRSIHLLDNRRVFNGVLEGAVYEFSSDAVIRDGSPLLAAPDRLFGQILVAKVADGGGASEDAIRSRLNDVAAMIPVFSVAPYKNNQVAWDPELGLHGHFAGVYRIDYRRNAPSFCVAVHTDGGAVSRSLVEQFIRPNLGRMTYRQLMDSNEYAQAHMQAKRNAKRLLALTADGFQLPIMKQDDIWQQTGEYDAPPDLGHPDISHVEYNLLHELPSVLRTPSIGFYSRCSRSKAVYSPTLAYLVDPSYGIQLHSSAATWCDTGAWSNKALAAFPIGTGRTTAVPQQKKSTTREWRQYVDLRVTWAKRTKETQVSSNARFEAYADYSEAKQRMHAETLGASHGSVRASPVAVVIPPPSAAAAAK